jgi:cytochrome c oxidase subunit II
MIEWFAQKILLMPALYSSTGRGVDELIVYVHWLMLALFVGWMVYFFYAIYRFSSARNPRADYEGVKSHASNYIELTVAGIEAVLLVGIAVPIWARNMSHLPAADKSTVIQVCAQQYAWNVLYPGPDNDFGDESMSLVSDTNVFGLDYTDKETHDDFQKLNEIHCVVNKPVVIYVTSKDVIHSLKINAMRICQDAIPGLRIPVWFTPDKTGRYQINCAQLCGPGHSSMSDGFLIVQSQADYDKWTAAQSVPSSSSFQ